MKEKKQTIWKPTEKQLKVLTCPADEILFGGARGGGKSEALLVASLGTPKCGFFNNPNWSALIVRRTFPELQKTIIQKSLKLLTGKAKYDQVKHKWTSACGGILQFGVVENDIDVWKHLGEEYNFLGIEELTTFTEYTYHFLKSGLRTTDPNIKRLVMATSNPWGTGHCVPFGEVLTDTGWVSIKDVKIGDLVATVNDDNELIYVPVNQFYSQQYCGKLLKLENATHFIIATPDHKIAKHTETKNKNGRIIHNKIKLTKISDLSLVTRLVRSSGDWKGVEIKSFSPFALKTRKRRLSQPSEISGEDFCELLGWFLSEGYTVDRDKAFGISQMKPGNRELIEKLLVRCGFKYGESEQGFLVHAIDWWNYFRSFGKCREKYVPEIIKNSTKKQLGIFLESAMKGDGHGKTYYTTSKKLSDDMQEIGLKLGYSPRITERQRENRIGLSYEIIFRDGRDGIICKKDFKEVDYDGDIYCLGIEDLHRFFIRQNGIVWLSGNSWVKKRFIDVAKPEEFYEETTKLPNGELIVTSRVFIPATVFDNPHIQSDYIATLDKLPDAEKKAFLYGDWNIFTGQFFSMFGEEHKCEPFKVPFGWPIWISMDYGAETVTAIGLYTQDPQDKTYYMWDEIYMTKETKFVGTTPDYLSQLIKEKLGKHFTNLVGRFGDKRLMVRDDQIHISTKEKFSLHGIHFSLANDERIEGWRRSKELLMKDRSGNVQFKVFNTCKNFLRTIPEMIHDIHNPEDMYKHGETHHADQFRYFSIMRKAEETDDSSNSVYHYNPITGYLMDVEEKDLLSVSFPGLKIDRTKNYFMDRFKEEQNVLS